MTRVILFAIPASFGASSAGDWRIAVLALMFVASALLMLYALKRVKI